MAISRPSLLVLLICVLAKTATAEIEAFTVGDVPLVHTAQILPLDTEGNVTGKNAAAQVEQVLSNLDGALLVAKSSQDGIVKLNMYVAAHEHVEDVRRALSARFSGKHQPALSFVISPLPKAGALVAVDAVATTKLDPGRAVARFPQTAVIPNGMRIYVAGQAEKGETLTEATRKTLESLRATLRYLGRRDEDIVQLKAFLTPMASAADVQREVTNFFGGKPAPLVFVEWKSSATTPIEIELIAWGGANNAGERLEFVTPPGMTASPVYSRVAIVDHSKSIYISGLYAPQVEGEDPTKPESGQREVKEVFSSLERILKKSGSDLRHLAKATYYVSSDAASKKLNELRPNYYDPKRPPSASKAVVAGTGRGNLGLTLDMIAVPVDSDEKGEYGPPEFGNGLSQADAAAGWISLFDGKTTFGWRDAKVVDGALSGDATTAKFGNCELRAIFAKGGTFTVGDRQIRVSEGKFHLAETSLKPDLIARIWLGDGACLSRLEVRPLGLEPLFNGRDMKDWKRIDHPKLAEEKRPTWKVEDGAIRASGGPGCVEFEGGRYGDMVLALDVRTRVRHANGGVFFRAIPGDFMNGYEAQVFNRAEDGDPSRPAVWSTGGIDDRQNARRLVSRDHQYYRMTIIARGNHIATWVNGFQQTDFTDTRAPHENARNGLRTEPGVIQLQAHDPGTDVEFKNIGVGKW